MLNGWFRGERTIVWKAREMLAAGEIDTAGFMDLVASSAPSVGYCNTMGTAPTMNSLAEAMGMQLPGSAAIPTAGVDFHVPFGGRKGSGYGPREQGKYAAEFFTVVKASYTQAPAMLKAVYGTARDVH
jgi:hypothetical protein